MRWPAPVPSPVAAPLVSVRRSVRESGVPPWRLQAPRAQPARPVTRPDVFRKRRSAWRRYRQPAAGKSHNVRRLRNHETLRLFNHGNCGS